jgi:hypothetical protein
MKDIVFNIKDNEMEIFLLKKLFNRVTIDKMFYSLCTIRMKYPIKF